MPLAIDTEVVAPSPFVAFIVLHNSKIRSNFELKFPIYYKIHLDSTIKLYTPSFCVKSMINVIVSLLTLHSVFFDLLADTATALRRHLTVHKVQCLIYIFSSSVLDAPFLSYYFMLGPRIIMKLLRIKISFAIIQGLICIIILITLRVLSFSAFQHHYSCTFGSSLQPEIQGQMS